MTIFIYRTIGISGMFPVFSPTKVLDSLILMQIVSEGPLHGYAITALLEERFDWKPSQTAVYNSLKSMESENLVRAEEKIEKGRVQKIYSITDYGKEFFNETQQKIRKHMSENFSQFFSLVQMVGEITNSEESAVMQASIQAIIENMRKTSRIILLLVRVAPKETQKILEDTLLSLSKLAASLDIQILGDDTLNE
ncbi:MAG: PadR family transcriptional regulator [Candidatus Heimdallarchaeota archaeon]|nr:PadR family transcriptional regulator [Candidatus Heimdallarchaeota archaeon]